MTGPYQNWRVPPYAERQDEIRKLRRKGYVPVGAVDSALYRRQGRKVWVKLLLSFGERYGVCILREGPSLERTGREG
jgi:hypothetical protein